MKTSLYNQDGSLHSEAQFLLSFKSSNMSIGDWKKRTKAFKSQLSVEDLKEFERLKRKYADAEQRAKKPKVIDQIEIREINLYDGEGRLHPEARELVSLRPEGMTRVQWSKKLDAFVRCLSDEDATAFSELRLADFHKRRMFRQALKETPEWFDPQCSKIDLFSADGSLCEEAQFFMGLRIDTLPTKEEQRVVRLRLKHFMDRLSEEDLKVFKKIKRRELDRLRQMRYRDNNREKVNEYRRKINNVYLPKWNAANPEKSKARSDRYITKRAAKRFQERLEKYPEFYAGWVDEETISLHKEDGTLFCDSISLLIKAKPENLPKHDWVRILKDFRSKLSAEDNKEFAKLRRREMDSKSKRNERRSQSIKFKLRKAVENAFNRIKKNKPARTLELLGCTWEEARLHMESLFQEGMTWENHGLGDDKWHIDHIRPVCSFEDHELHLMSHISNLRPLWQKDNFTKRNFDRKLSVKNKKKDVGVDDQALTNVASAPRPSLEALPSVTS